MSSPIVLHTFEQLGLAAPILKAIKDAGYESPSPIQAESIPVLLAGKDLVGQAQTGTGKTAAFALPLLSRIDVSNKYPQVLVLTPTRELCIQVSEAFQRYARHLSNFHVLPIYGGQSMSTQLRQLQRGVHVVVGTPGRIMDHLRRGTLNLDGLSCLVLDEADEMLNMGFIEDVEWILEKTPSERQIALFSATMPPAIIKIAQRYLVEAKEIRIKAKTTTVESITQRYLQVTGIHKLDALTRILEVEEFEAIIIFVRTKVEAVELAEKLEARGYACAPLNGDMNQALREKTIERIKNKTLDIVVATDVAARGLDVERVSHVINYDIPYDTEAYVHRIGRTGRAGRKGQAILFVEPRERRLLQAIERSTRQPITPMHLPSAQSVTNQRITQFKQLISDTIKSQDLNFFEGLIKQYEEEHDATPEQLAAALAFLVQRDKPLVLQEIKPSASFEREKRPRQKEKTPAEGRRLEQGMIRYRIEVGREQGVQPKNIVGAIANETGVDSQNIGHIKIYDTYSTVDLPEGMSRQVVVKLKNIWICNKKINASIEGAKPQVEQAAQKQRKFKGESHPPQAGRNDKRKARRASKNNELKD